MAASTQLITDLKSAYSTGPSANTQANAIAAAGPVQDAFATINLALIKLEEANRLLTSFGVIVDSGDPIKSTVANVLLSLV